MARVTGGCHCGAVRFEAEVDAQVTLEQCNCSICAPSAYLHLYVRHEDFRLSAAAGALSSYRFGTGKAEHLFCRTCGVKSFYQPRSHPGHWSVNFRCLDKGHGLNAGIAPFDGENWEQAQAARPL